MNIGMIVYSRTGNTLSVAEKLEARLSAAGHAVTLKRLAVVGRAATSRRRRSRPRT